jgi:hypothetical protein
MQQRVRHACLDGSVDFYRAQRLPLYRIADMCVWTADINLSVASRTSPARRPWTRQSSTQQGAPHRGLEIAARIRQCPCPSYSLALH